MTIRPARIDFSADPPRSLDYGDVYHPAGGPRGQSAHVFLGGNDLPARWRGRADFSILETGFGLGHNFLATWQAWREDPRRCERLHYVSLEAHPPSREDLQRAHPLPLGKEPVRASAQPLPPEACTPPADAAPVDRHLATMLMEAWPPGVAGLHLCHFDQGRVRLCLGFGDAAQLLPRLIGRFDAFFLDGFAPAVNPALWEPRLLKSLGRVAAPDATAATWSVARSVRQGLSAAGFVTAKAPGFGAKREMTRAHFAPRAPASPPPGRPEGSWPGGRHAVIIGAGLAGAGVAQALARRGWRCTVVDKRTAPAGGASGNPAGLFHPVVHRTDGVYARLHRAAAFLAHGHYRPLVESGRVPGAVDGLLLHRPVLTEGHESPAGPRVTGREPGTDGVSQGGDGQGWIRSLTAEEARRASGAWRDGPAWHLAQAGWIDPAALVRHWLSLPGIDFIGNCAVHSIVPPTEWGHQGELRDVHGQVIARAPLIVLAQGTGVLPWVADGLIDTPPLSTTRGQLTWFSQSGPLRQPVSGDGYALPLPDGRLLCGASSQPGDPSGDDALPLREEDHRWNLERLERLTGLSGPGRPRAAPAIGAKDMQPAGLGGRAQWRLNAPDRLPLIGPAAAPAHAGERRDQARFVRRLPGLFLATAFGSRGLAWAPLAGEVIAAWTEGTPMPLEADLVDAIDPARWPVRRHRQASRVRPG